VLEELRECEQNGLPAPFYAADAKMADSIMDFLFASQVRCVGVSLRPAAFRGQLSSLNAL